jgi:hypothetical protein
MVDLWSHLSSAIWRRASAAIRPLGRVRWKATSFMGPARHKPIAFAFGFAAVRALENSRVAHGSSGASSSYAW